MDVKKEYTNGEVTVVWKPGLCIHSANCVGGSPDVFKPKDKPWIQPENAPSKEIMATIEKCPSGALSYYRNSEGPGSEKKEKTMKETKVEVLANGPLMVHGAMEVIHADGRTETKSRSTAFCRCGKTGNTPFCDGSHKA